ncbi:MAG TPA: hypothetical protein DEQ14_06760 [Treponema sp.]|nr:hypothetical protein [Treponema sp.]
MSHNNPLLLLSRQHIFHIKHITLSSALQHFKYLELFENFNFKTTPAKKIAKHIAFYEPHPTTKKRKKVSPCQKKSNAFKCYNIFIYRQNFTFKRNNR